MTDKKDIVRMALPRETWRLLERWCAAHASITPIPNLHRALEGWSEDPLAANVALGDFLAGLNDAGILKGSAGRSSDELRKAGRGI